MNITIEQATTQYHAVSATIKRQRAKIHAHRAASPTASRVKDNATGREGVQVDMWGLFMVIQFEDGSTELRNDNDVTLISKSRYGR